MSDGLTICSCPGHAFEEVKRRSHKMGAAFRTEDSCLLMFYAVVRTLHFRKVLMTN